MPLKIAHSPLPVQKNNGSEFVKLAFRASFITQIAFTVPTSVTLKRSDPSVSHPSDVVDRDLEPNLRDYIRDLMRSKSFLSSSMFAGLYRKTSLKSSVISLLWDHRNLLIIVYFSFDNSELEDNNMRDKVNIAH